MTFYKIKIGLFLSLFTTFIYADPEPGSWLYLAQEMSIFTYLSDSCDDISLEDKQRAHQLVDDLTDIIESKGFTRDEIDSLYTDALDKKVRSGNLSECKDFQKKLLQGERLAQKLQ